MHGAQPIAITRPLLYNLSIGCKFSPARRGYGSSGMSHGFSKEASRCRIEAFCDIQFERILRPKPDGGKNGSDGIMAGPSWAKAIGVR